MEITFEQLPNAVNQLFGKLENIERLLLQTPHTTQPEPEKLLTVQEAANFLTLSVPTIYLLISKGELPVCKRGKRCYFSNKDLMDYVKAGRKKTVSEIESEVDNYLINHKKKSGK
jgi:excisionase family DNA binding protein